MYPVDTHKRYYLVSSKGKLPALNYAPFHMLTTTQKY